MTEPVTKADLQELKKEHLIPILEQLKTLNGKVAENTKFRERAKGALVVVAFIGFTGIIAWLSLLGKTL